MNEEADASGAAGREDEHQMPHYISLLCLLSLSLVSPAATVRDRFGESSSRCSRRLPITEADGNSLRKLLLSKISGILQQDFSTDLFCLIHALTPAGDLLALLKGGQSPSDSTQSSDLKEFNSKSKKVISMMKAMTIGIEALAKMINFEAGDAESSDEEVDDDEEDEWSDFSGSEDEMNAMSGLKGEGAENRKDERLSPLQNSICRTSAAAPVDALFVQPDATRRTQTGRHDGSKMMSSPSDSERFIICGEEDGMEKSSFLTDYFNKLMKLVIRLLITPVPSHEEKMILKNVPAGAEILDNLFAMQINILISIACCGEQLPDAMSEHDAGIAVQTMFSLVRSHSQKFVHHKQPNSEASDADMTDKNEHRSGGAEKTTAKTTGDSEKRLPPQSAAACSLVRDVRPDAGHEAEQDREIIRGCVYALRSLMQRCCVCLSADQMRMLASLIHGQYGAGDHSIPIACIKVLGACGCRKSDVALTSMISNLLMELLEESPLLLPVQDDERQEASSSGSASIQSPGEEGEFEPAPSQSILHPNSRTC